jgi:hypothetical protein
MEFTAPFCVFKYLYAPAPRATATTREKRAWVRVPPADSGTRARAPRPLPRGYRVAGLGWQQKAGVRLITVGLYYAYINAAVTSALVPKGTKS